mmetsp:Transcript_14088/g.31158  ORF Transcript_14088/g.31158 Transcript_14088/m.31158 type:complete len:339 (-) Transcript_14088:324-1340(-)
MPPTVTATRMVRKKVVKAKPPTTMTRARTNRTTATRTTKRTKTTRRTKAAAAGKRAATAKTTRTTRSTIRTTKTKNATSATNKNSSSTSVNNNKTNKSNTNSNNNNSTSASSTTTENRPWFSVFAGTRNMEYESYMRNEWGWEKRGDVPLFEKLCLEGQQAGLSWATVLAKRKAYRKAFHNFNIRKCAKMTDKDVDRLLAQQKKLGGGRQSVICHRGKLLSIPANARCVLNLRSAPLHLLPEGDGSPCRTLDALLWSFVEGKPILNQWSTTKEIPTVTPTATAMSKVLKKLGFSFVGETICYSLMQSCGLVIDHPKGTPEHRAAVARLKRRGGGGRRG